MNLLEEKLKHFIDNILPYQLSRHFDYKCYIDNYNIKNHENYLLVFMTIKSTLEKHKHKFKRIWYKIEKKKDFLKLRKVIRAANEAITEKKYYWAESKNFGPLKKHHHTYKSQPHFKKYKKYITDL